MSETESSLPPEVSIRDGFAAGALTFALGYLVTYVWQSGTIRDSIQGYNAVIEFFGGDPIPAWQAVGWLFYNAHFVAVTYPTLGGGRVSMNLIADGNAPTLLYLLPPVVLVAVGFVLARSAGARDLDSGAIAGASLVLGYVVFAVLGLVAFRYSAAGSTMHPEYSVGVLLAGVFHPVVFGGIGGALGASTAT
jgi:hypothetical protein